MGLTSALANAFKYFSELLENGVLKLFNKFSGWYSKNGASKITTTANDLSDELGKSGRWLKELAKSGIAEYMGSILSKEGMARLIDRIVNTAIALAIAYYVLQEWYNNYIKNRYDTVCNGSLPPDMAFRNLISLMEQLIVLCQLTEADEFSELFYEGLSGAIGEILEKQMVGGLAITTACWYGSEPMDDDEVKDLAGNRAICERSVDYEVLLTGMYNTSGVMEKCMGRYYTYKDMINQVHNDILYHNMRMWEIISYPIDMMADQIRAIYKNVVIDSFDDLDSQINKYKTQLYNLYGLLDAIISDIEGYSDEDWRMLPIKSKHSYEKQVNRYIGKIRMLYEIDVLQTAQQIDEQMATINEVYQKYMELHNSKRAELINRLIRVEQELYKLYYDSSINGYKNVKSVRSGGSLTDYETYKNYLGEL